jgi:hypothetical protein
MYSINQNHSSVPSSSLSLPNPIIDFSKEVDSVQQNETKPQLDLELEEP